MIDGRDQNIEESEAYLVPEFSEGGRLKKVLRAAVDATPDVFFVKDQEHRLLLVSRSLATSMGLTPAEIEGRPDTDFWPQEVCEAPPGSGKSGYHDEDRVALGGKTTRITETVILGDEAEHVFQTDRFPVFDGDGSVFAILGFARDITASILLEARTKELEETARALEDSNRRLSAEVQARRRAEDELRVTNRELEERVEERTRALSRKIEEQERSEAERQELEVQLRQAQKLEAIGRLAGGIAHDFNNVLQMIVGGIELVSCQLPHDLDASRQLDSIMNATQRAGALTSQLLAFARTQPGNAETIEVNASISSLVSMLRPLVGEMIEVQFEPSPEPCWIELGVNQLDQVLTNLVINSGDAIRGHGTISIKVQRAALPSDTGRVGIEVSDTGCGMGPEIQTAIFDPFFSTKAAGQGTGLGLSTVYGIVKQYSGDISVHSTPGIGTRFELEFPESAPAVPVATFSPLVKQRFDGARLLLVEDEPAVLDSVEKMLSMHGFEVIPCAGPIPALQVIASETALFDLMITDVAMPQMTGRALASQVRESLPNLPVLFMSGHTADVFTGEPLLDQGDEYIQKPFRFAELIGKIQEILQRSRVAE